MDRVTLRSAAYIALCFIYGVWCSATPATLGWAEIAVGVALAIAVDPLRALRVTMDLGAGAGRWPQVARLLLFYALSVPVLAGLVAGNDPGMMIRDIIPFLFLLLPFFTIGWMPDARMATAATAFIGVAFAARVVWPVVTTQSSFIGVGLDPLYLSISPTISFAAVLLGGVAGLMLYREVSARSLAVAAGLVMLAVLPLAAMVVTLQRAGLGLSLAALVFLGGVAVWRRPLRAAGPLLALAVVAVLAAPVIGDVSASLLRKHDLVGENSRLEEAAAVLESVGGSAFSVLFGRGWGAVLADPAVGGMTVNYTHNIATTYLLKTGLCGVLLMVLYLYGLCRPLLGVLRVNPVVAAALGVPILIDVTLYATFKSLDFGLILLLARIWAEKLQERPA